MTLEDISKPFCCGTTLKSDASNSDSWEDNGYFETYEEAKARYEELKDEVGRYVWLSEIGTYSTGGVTSEPVWITFRTNNARWWEELKVAQSERNMRNCRGRPDVGSQHFTIKYKSIS